MMDDLAELDFSFSCNKCSYTTKSILEIKVHAVEHKKAEMQTDNNSSTPGKESTSDVKNDQAKQSEQGTNSAEVDIPIAPLDQDAAVDIPIASLDQDTATGVQTGEQVEDDNDLVQVDFNNDQEEPSSKVDSGCQSESLQENEPGQSVEAAASRTEGAQTSDLDGHEKQNDIEIVQFSPLNGAEITTNVSRVKKEASVMVDMGTQMSPMPVPVQKPGRGRPPLGAAKRKAKIPVRGQVKEELVEEIEEEEEESTEEEMEPEDDDYEPPSIKDMLANERPVGRRKGHRPLTRSKSTGVPKKAKKPKPSTVHKCVTCGFTCAIKSELQNHMTEVHNEVVIKSEEVSDDAESDNENELVEGIPTSKRTPVNTDSIPDDRYTCIICKQFKCKFKKDLARHKHEAHNIGNPVQYNYVSTIAKDRYKCMQCNYVCKFQRQLRSHKRRVHPRPKTAISSRSRSAAKPKIHVPLDRYQCKECDFKCKFKGLLRAHRIKEHKKVPPPPKKKTTKEIECEHCGKIIRGTQHHLLRHLKTHTGEKPWECDICGAVFAERGRLNVHKPIHNEARPFLCEECGKSFKRAINLRMHRKIHVEVKPYQCELCAYRCTRHDTLNLHMKRKHLKLRRVLCTFCGKKFFSEKECQAHAGRKHLPRPTPFQCTLCPAAFPFAYNLRAHMKKHPEHKPYKCEYCGFESRSKASLMDHEKQHTAGKGPNHDPNKPKPYKCVFCAFRTSSQAYMKDHVKQHTGEKEKKCDLCDYETTTSSNLYKHRKRQHGILGMPARAHKGGRGRPPRANALLAAQGRSLPNATPPMAHQHLPLTLTISADDLSGHRPHHAEEERTAVDSIEDETEVVHINPQHVAVQVQHLYKDRKLMYTPREKSILGSVITDALAEARNVVQSDLYASHMIPTSHPSTSNHTSGPLQPVTVTHSGSTFTMAHTLPHGTVVNLPEGMIPAGIPVTAQGIPVTAQGLHVPVTVAMQNVQTPGHPNMFSSMMNMHY